MLFFVLSKVRRCVAYSCARVGQVGSAPLHGRGTAYLQDFDEAVVLLGRSGEAPLHVVNEGLGILQVDQQHLRGYIFAM